jgi:methionyl-tRNA synthetase
MFDYIVVGKGMFGAAAARRLSAVSANVAVIGPDEPTDPSRHTGVFASHYDQGRLQRHMSRNLVWAMLSHRAYREYTGIKAESGIQFYQPVDSVHLAPHRKDSVFVEAASETAERLGIACTMIPRGAEVMERFPMLRFPLDSHGYIEHFPAGYINPRDLIRAQLAIAAGRGATIVPDTVVQIRNQGDRVVVTTGAGTTYEARQVLITVGAYCNSFDLVERKLALRVKSETIILARISDSECARLTGMPSMIYELEAPPIDTIYMLPPIRYPDGHYYIKMGCNTESDRYLSTADDMGAWVRSGDSDVSLAAMADVMRSIIPGLDALSYETKRCLITYTPAVCPFIDRLGSDRIFVATGGNGMGAKSSVAIGQIAAEMMIHGRWVDEIPHEHFQVRFEDELARTGFSWGSCGMAKRLPTDPSHQPSPTAGTAAPAAVTKPQIHIRRRKTAAFQPGGGILMSSLHPWKGVADTPFGSAWALVEPGKTSQRHKHHEGETWIVMEGRGVVSVDGASEELGPGDAVYMPPFAPHTIHNPSDCERLVFLTLYWENLAAAAGQVHSGEHTPRASAPSRRRVLVTITPPTPNGDLHLGHLAGPYLGADIHARALRMQGCEAHYVTGSDDFQSYVAGKALRTGKTPEQVADHYAGGIETALRTAGVRCDQFSRNLRAPYVSLIQGMVKKLYAEGHVVAKACDYLVSPTDGRPLFEFYVSGKCPHCGSPAGGGCCEECGRLNEGIDLVDPVATLGGGPLTKKRITRLVLPLSQHADRIRALLDRMSMSTHLRSLAEGLLKYGLPDVPVTHPHHWGLPCTVAGFEDQVISTWFEMGHSMLEGYRQCRKSAGGSASDQNLLPKMAPEAGIEIVQFFGFDNGFYYALLYPLLYQLVDPGCEPPAALVCNEFYLLDGLKFSTSRNHAVWVRDILETEPADLVRFYLAHTRPESARTSFTTSAYQAFVTGELRGDWQSWLRDLGQRVREHFAGVAPEPGLWTDAHQRYYRDIEALLQRTREGYQAPTFSTQTVTHQLLELVRRARDLGHAERPLSQVAGRRDEYRTAMALELASARALAEHVAPIMPVFAGRLWQALGLEGLVEAHGFDAHLTFVPTGTRVALDGPLFAGSDPGIPQAASLNR